MGTVCDITYPEVPFATAGAFLSLKVRYIPSMALRSHSMEAMKLKARMVRQMLHLLAPHANLQTQVCHVPPHPGLSYETKLAFRPASHSSELSG